jgi:hypothetical protein
VKYLKKREQTLRTVTLCLYFITFRSICQAQAYILNNILTNTIIYSVEISRAEIYMDLILHAIGPSHFPFTISHLHHTSALRWSGAYARENSPKPLHRDYVERSTYVIVPLNKIVRSFLRTSIKLQLIWKSDSFINNLITPQGFGFTFSITRKKIFSNSNQSLIKIETSVTEFILKTSSVFPM